MIEQKDNPLWVERYRPRTIEECILPKGLRETFQKFIKDKNIPNLLLTGKAGVGKTTVAKAMLEELGCDYIVINGSLEGRNIDTVRTTILSFASSMSLTSVGRKYIILDEADYLNPQSSQPSLRNFMEEFSTNCGFILTCNYPQKILPALISRCSIVEFKIDKKEKDEIAPKFYKRVVDILDKEGVEYDKNVLPKFVMKYFPDFRRTLNELQRYSAHGKVDTGILSNLQETVIKELVGYMKEKNFTEVRKWVTVHSDLGSTDLYRTFYETAQDYFQPNSVPAVVLIIAKYQYQEAFVQDKDINTAACMVEIMLECQFK